MEGGRGCSIALKADGTMLSWGNDSNGQLGDDQALFARATPKAVALATSVIAVSVGNRHTLALKSDGTLYSWGFDGNGELGNDAALENQVVIQELDLLQESDGFLPLPAGEGRGEGVSAANALDVQGQQQLAALAPLTRLRRPLPQGEATKHFRRSSIESCLLEDSKSVDNSVRSLDWCDET